MNIVSRIKLFFGIIFVGLICFGLALYIDNQSARVGSTSALLETESYSVGSEYGGIIAIQNITDGDHVLKDQVLFEVSSDTLKKQLKTGDIKAEDLNYKLTASKNIQITAPRDGTVGKISILQGSFVTAGDVIATISDTQKAVVSGEFYLSGPQYALLSPNSPVLITLSGNKKTTGIITSINQHSKDGKTITTVEVTIQKIDDRQTVYDNSSPVSMELTLKTTTLFTRLKHTAETRLR